MSATTTRKFKKPVHPKAKISFRKHFVPPFLGIAMFASVFGLLNSQWVIAQVQYRTTQPTPDSSFVINTSAPNRTSVNLSIPKINVNAPVIYDEKSYDDDKILVALRSGVVHYGTTAMPGQAGNIVVVGHSSGQPWAPGDYKFVFTMLDKLVTGDRIILDYEGTRYIFKVTGSKVVKPTEMSVTNPTDQPQLTLITCTPVGTMRDRLVITARQVSPNPATATKVDPKAIKPVTASSFPQ